MRKTDAHVQQDVIAELKWDPSIDATHIQVAVFDGIVAISGSVSNQAEKLNIERSIQRVSGVNAVNINLEYLMSDTNKKSDIEITFRVINLLQWTTYCEEAAIDVTAENGWVTLAGEVDCQYQKDAIVDIIHHLAGVTGIINHIGIKQIAATDDIKSEIEQALTRHLDKSAEHILIDVRAGEVTLTGTVQNWHDATIAVKSASSTRGVWNVQNKISVNSK